jgi:hypothetical protein
VTQVTQSDSQTDAEAPDSSDEALDESSGAEMTKEDLEALTIVSQQRFLLTLGYHVILLDLSDQTWQLLNQNECFDLVGSLITKQKADSTTLWRLQLGVLC